jgi:hypothetical protein
LLLKRATLAIVLAVEHQGDARDAPVQFHLARDHLGGRLVGTRLR